MKLLTLLIILIPNIILAESFVREAPNGRLVEFPEGTSEDIIEQYFALPEYQPKPTNKTEMNELLKNNYEIIEINSNQNYTMYILQNKHNIYHCKVWTESARLISCNPLRELENKK